MAGEPGVCPTCGRPAWPPGSNPSPDPAKSPGVVETSGRPRPDPFPFCSFRCQMVDLGRWIDEEYRVGDGEDQSGGGADGAPAPGDDGAI